LVIYCGTIVTEEGKEKKVNIDFEPFKPINTSLYLCDNKVWFFFFVIFKVFKDKS
jgi:peptide subunit release factor 1 (eRF1)